MRIYKFWDKPVGTRLRLPWPPCALNRHVGPHPTAMFEVNTFSPHQTGVLFTWLVVNRGPCSYVVLNWIVCRDLIAPPEARPASSVRTAAAIGSLPPDQKPRFGAALNEAKGRVEAAIAARRELLGQMERAERERAEALDVSLPGRAPLMGRLHPLTNTMDEVKQVLIGLGFEFRDSNDIQNYRYNFDWLNYPPDHPAMDEQMSFYVSPTHLLRTQTTALQGHILERREPPFRIATVGRCYRYEAVDATHHHTFHQATGLQAAASVTPACPGLAGIRCHRPVVLPPCRRSRHPTP